ncbi:hypothetical protein HXX76_000797 [Chlamydomonas incerta]|uniref:Uncharacterized protein n=1 Tax=Chlamydomonas incerta TaxID=51695 RepID=A0A835WES7_CHLIN|nr:hypothetical protein HXX76_000797 [Chlamydomonas incerta]|eukprot:KAG2446204.1 hypothetical protein HXX76_000797 [Chlamydomonas incerta]
MASPGRAFAAPLVLLALAAALLAVPASAGSLAAARASGFLPRRALQQTCLTCSGLTTCITATCLYSSGSLTYVQIDLSGCKGASISWFCCQQNTCTTTTCDNTQVNGATCNDVLTSTVTTLVGATSVTLQVHDGRLIGDYNCGAPGNSCCGGDGGSCGSGSNVCDDVVVPITGLSTPVPPSCPPGCYCGDTAWGFPKVDQFTNAAQTTEQQLVITDAGYSGKVFWTPRQVGGAWGGWFRITTPDSGAGALNLGICAGCGQNVAGKGYYFGTGFSISFTSFSAGTSTIQIKPLPSTGTIASVVNMQVFLSFIAPPDLNPGGFKTFTDYGPAVTPTSPLTTFPANFFANVKPGVTYKVGSSTFTVPTSITASGLYLALHLDVGAYCPSGYQWGR